MNVSAPTSSFIRPDFFISSCMRCGACCKKGGPSFHLEDKNLIDEGFILLKYLFTIRKGEIAYDNIKGCLQPVDTDIIKIRGRKESWECIFFDEQTASCGIYENRPMECRILQCWDTSQIEQVYAQNRLTRKDLLYDIEGLWSLIEEHQSRCAYDKFEAMIKNNLVNKQEAIRDEINEMLHYDAWIRRMTVEKSRIDPEMMDFLFGRPLTDSFPLRAKK